METSTENIKQEYLSDFAVLLKKMRLLKKLTRQQAGLLFDFSYKNIERLENGRGAITVEKFKEFQEKYGYSDSEIEDLRSGKIQASTDANSIRRKSGVPYTGTHILRHGMAKLARQVGGGLDAVLAMTGHKDLKLADHYSKCTEDDQKHFSEKIMEHIRNTILKDGTGYASLENVISLKEFKNAINS